MKTTSTTTNTRDVTTMTEPPVDPVGAPLGNDARARIEALQRRRATSEQGGAEREPALVNAPRSARKRSATATKVAAAGIGGMTMFGLVAAMGLANGESTGASAPVQATRPVVVVIHQPDAAGGSAAVGERPVRTVPSSADAGRSEAVAPIELRAQPVVTAVEVQVDQPRVSTNGSR